MGSRSFWIDALADFSASLAFATCVSIPVVAACDGVPGIDPVVLRVWLASSYGVVAVAVALRSLAGTELLGGTDAQRLATVRAVRGAVARGTAWPIVAVIRLARWVPDVVRAIVWAGRSVCSWVSSCRRARAAERGGRS